MSALRMVVLAWAACIVGVGGGAGVARVTWPEPAAPAAPEQVDCQKVDQLGRPLLALPTVAPTTGYHPVPRSDFDFARAEDERRCLALDGCLAFTDHARTDVAAYAIVLGASRLGGAPSATLRIAGMGDGLVVPPFASDASIHEGDLVPTLAGVVRVIAIRAHDPDTQVTTRLVEPAKVAPDPMRFFLGPNIGALAADHQLSLGWNHGVAHVTARKIIPVGPSTIVQIPVEQDVTTSMTVGAFRYRVTATHAPTATDAGWIELDARPTAAL